jgi:cysteinyl-tRNA synthetase
MHNGYINIDNEKMSKSLGNVKTVVDLRKQYKKEVLRYFILSAHYRNPLNFNADIMRQAEQSVARIANAVGDLNHRLGTIVGDGVDDAAAEALRTRTAEIVAVFNDKLRDDFNTPDAITAVYDLVSASNTYLQQPVVHRATVEGVLAAFEQMNAILGIIPAPEAGLLDADIEALIVARTEARQAKNWARADEIRDQLQAEGITLEDTPQGIRWKRK